MTDPQMRRIRKLFDAADETARAGLLELAEARAAELIGRLPDDSTWKASRPLEGVSSTETLADGLLARIPRAVAESQGEVDPS